MKIPVCIFAKPPAPLEAKTRLIPLLGAEDAAQLASAMLSDAWCVARSHPGIHPILATTGPGAFPMSVPEQDVWYQGEGDLGDRIERILTRGLLHAPAAIAIGADSPAFSQAHLQTALERLAIHDAVLGPALDGGFYLLALRRCPPGLFASLPWSTAETCRALADRLRAHAFSIAELEPLFDVDTPGDLRALAAYLETTSSPSATRAWWRRSSCESRSLFPR
jgi:hypothetical protein